MTAPTPVPKFSVITVVRNGEATLRQTIESVLSQADPSIEYLIVDGASDDGTLAIIQEYGDKITWISERDNGIYDAMNKGLLLARGDWSIFLGADDQFLIPLKDIESSMTDRSAVYYGNVMLESSGAIYEGKFSKFKLMQKNICHQAIFYPRHIYSSKRYSTSVGMLADYEYNIEVWGSGTKFKYLDFVITRFNDMGASASMGRSFETAKLLAIKRSFGMPFYVYKRIRGALRKSVSKFANLR